MTHPRAAREASDTRQTSVDAMAAAGKKWRHDNPTDAPFIEWTAPAGASLDAISLDLAACIRDGTCRPSPAGRLLLEAMLAACTQAPTIGMARDAIRKLNAGRGSGRPRRT